MTPVPLTLRIGKTSAGATTQCDVSGWGAFYPHNTTIIFAHVTLPNVILHPRGVIKKLGDC